MQTDNKISNGVKKQVSKTTETAKTEEVKKEVTRRKFTGEVVSDKMEKTIVVKVAQTKIHPKYQKRYTTTAKYKVHDEKNQYKTGDKVAFVECRPMSKDKRWRAVY